MGEPEECKKRVAGVVAVVDAYHTSWEHQRAGLPPN